MHDYSVGLIKAYDSVCKKAAWTVQWCASNIYLLFQCRCAERLEYLLHHGAETWIPDNYLSQALCTNNINFQQWQNYIATR